MPTPPPPPPRRLSENVKDKSTKMAAPSEITIEDPLPPLGFPLASTGGSVWILNEEEQQEHKTALKH